MQIHQIQARHEEVQDRILLRLSTDDDCEFQFWFTRRFMKRFWPVLVKLLERDDAVRLQSDAEARRAVLGMRHEAFVRQGDFSTAFEERTYRRPFGAEPLLVARADCTPRADGVVLLSLRPLEGQGVDLALNAALLHSLCKLLADTLEKCDWDIESKAPQSALDAGAGDGQAPRTVN